MEKVFLKEVNKCNGCSACANVCPKNCVTMKADDLGFLYPQIDNELCINCGICEKTCPVFNKTVMESLPKTYALKNKDTDIVYKSSSGGAFTAISEEIIRNGGVVFGVAFSEDFKSVRHIAVENSNDLSLLRGSKYVQSEIGDSYFKAKEYLKNGRQVFFTGTPCQIEGLLSYLKKPYDNLLTQDIICHGVPAPEVWKNYIEQHETEYDSKIKNVDFRYKGTGWATYSVLMTFENGKKYCVKNSQDPYMKGFIDNIDLRSSCYDCAFKTASRKADITLADFWGVWKLHPEFYSENGVSLVLCHSEKGNAIINSIANRVDIIEADPQKALEFNSAATKSVPHNHQRESFIKDFKELPFDEVMKKYCTPLKPNPIKSKIKSIVKRFIK